MQKTEHLARLFHRSATVNVFSIVSALLVVTTVSACAGEPVKTLAMVTHHQPPVESHVQSQAAAATNPPSRSSVALSRSTNSPSVAPRPEKATAAEFTTEIRLEKPDKSGQSDPLQLVHKNLTTSSRSNVAFTVQAGYGRIWDESSMLRIIDAGHQETGCAYLSANISF